MRKRRARKSGIVLCALLMAGIMTMGAMTEIVYAASYLFSSTTIYADGTRTSKFTCNGMTGFCCEAGAYSTYSGTASLSRMKNTTNAARCAYVYGYKKGWTSGSNAHKLARLLSWCMGNGTGGDYKESTMKSLLATAKKTDVPSGFECWHCKPNGNSRQDFIVWKFPKGSLKIVKKSGNTGISGKGAYTLKGMTFKVYSDAACTKLVKTLTTAKDGSTGGTFSLPVGTYYIKETSVPASTGYVKNTKVVKVTIKSGTATSVKMANQPATGSIAVRKKTAGEGGTVEGFKFILKGKTSGKTYTLVTGTDGTAKVADLPLGKYTLQEVLTEKQEKCYTDRTGTQTVTLAKGSGTQNITLERKNDYAPDQKLKIVKQTGDGGPVSGFRFHIRWVLPNAGKITAEEIVRAAAPRAELSGTQNLGIWQIADPEEIEAINEAAKKGKTGTYTVTLRNSVTGEPDESEEETKDASRISSEDGKSSGSSNQSAGDGDTKQNAEGSGVKQGTGGVKQGTSGEDRKKDETGNAADTGKEDDGDKKVDTGKIDQSEEDEGSESGDARSVQIRVKLELTERNGSAELTPEKDETTAASGAYEIHYHNARYSGAAETGEKTVTTDSTGQYVFEHIRPGVYTVTEEMTERQKKRYRQPEPQTIEVKEGSEESIVFSFRNEPIQIPVKLKKYSPDGKIEGMEFTLSGTPDYAAEPMEDMVLSTDENGIADFGMLYPGHYVIEETGYDKGKYVNTYPMEGRAGPAFAFTVTGEELSEKQIQQGWCLWLGGKPGQGAAVPGASEPNQEGDATGAAEPGQDGDASGLSEPGQKEGASDSSEPGSGTDADSATFRNTPYVDLWLTKVDGVTRSFLPGAEFSLKDSNDTLAARFRIDADEAGDPVPVVLESNGTLTASAGEETRSAAVVIGGEPAEKTEYRCIVLHGLIEGEKYTLTEEHAPEGFTPLEDPYVFTVTINEKGEPELNTCDEYAANIAEAEHKATLVIVNDAPSIKTLALNKATGEHVAEAHGKVTIIDTCRVTNLRKGQTYTMVARLMDSTEYRDDGQDGKVKQVRANGRPVASLVTFRAEGWEEEIKVPISLEAAALKGRRTVVYESLYTGEITAEEAEKETTTAEEADPGTRSQTIYFPGIGTTAALASDHEIRDEVKYSSLQPGRLYVMKGRLMNRTTGKPVPDSIAGAPAKKEFQADESGSGTVTVSFDIDAKQLAQKGITDLVVYEQCFLVSGDNSGGKLLKVASHEDLTDADQTVKLPKDGSPPTGDENRPWLALALLITVTLAGVLAICKGWLCRG